MLFMEEQAFGVSGRIFTRSFALAFSFPGVVIETWIEIYTRQ